MQSRLSHLLAARSQVSYLILGVGVPVSVSGVTWHLCGGTMWRVKGPHSCAVNSAQHRAMKLVLRKCQYNQQIASKHDKEKERKTLTNSGKKYNFTTDPGGIKRI